MLTLERLALDAVVWQELDAFPDRTVFQSLPWLNFLIRTQHGEPVVARLSEGGETRGYFTGMIISKLGCRILGSPFPGWATWYMGFNLEPGVSRHDAMSALIPFAFRDLRCQHIELIDRHFSIEDAVALGLEHEDFPGYEIDLSRSEGELFAAMTSDCRNKIRQAERKGVAIQEADDPGFVDDFYAQLLDVFAKDGLVPAYSKEFARDLIVCLAPTGRLLRLRALDPDGRCIATCISPAMNGTAYVWGGASWRPHQHLRPNEALQWYAIRYWKARGYRRYEMGGGRGYKAKYGGSLIWVPLLRKSKYAVIADLRDVAQQAVRRAHRLAGFVRGRSRAAI